MMVTQKLQEEKLDFYRNKKLLFKIDETDINKIFVSKREPYGRKKSFKYFIGYDEMMTIICK